MHAHALTRYLLLFSGLYLAFGSESAFFPTLLKEHGLAAGEIGLVLATGTVMRVLAGPCLGNLADRTGSRSYVFASAALAAAGIGTLYLFARGLLPLLAVSAAHAVAIASLAPLADTLASTAAAHQGFKYGWIRGAGSAAFITGTIVAGLCVASAGIGSIIVLSAAFFLLSALPALWSGAERGTGSSTTGIGPRLRTLASIAPYRNIVVIASLVIGSHVVNDAFGVIIWKRAGLGDVAVSLLWSEAVGAEVLVFFLVGPRILDMYGSGGAAAISALAGVLRWSCAGALTSPEGLAAFQALHGLTFSLMHLAVMDVIISRVPQDLAATAQTVYGTAALGATSAFLTLGSGYLFALTDLYAYWAMAGLCGAALCLTPALRRARDGPGHRLLSPE